jgi:hypothetical protein
MTREGLLGEKNTLRMSRYKKRAHLLHKTLWQAQKKASSPVIRHPASVIE